MSLKYSHKLWGIVLLQRETSSNDEFSIPWCDSQDEKGSVTLSKNLLTLEHTLERVEHLIPRERIVVVTSLRQRNDMAEQLTSLPQATIVWEPKNRGMAASILLALAHIQHRMPFPTVAVFPSDQFAHDTKRFMSYVKCAAEESKIFPKDLTFLGATQEYLDKGFQWIEPATAEYGRKTLPVRRYYEKLTSAIASKLLQNGGLQNTSVFTAQGATLWELIRLAGPDLYEQFMHISRALGKSHYPLVLKHMYDTMCPVSFFSDICQTQVSRLRVLPVPDGIWNEQRNRTSIFRDFVVDSSVSYHTIDFSKRISQ